MMILKIAAVGLVGGVLTIFVRRSQPELAMPVGIVAGVIVLSMSLEYLTEAVTFVQDFVAAYPAASEGISAVLKIVAVGYIAEFSAQLLKDAGEGAVAAKVELGGKLCILVLCLPMISEFAELLLSMLPGG